MVVALWLAPACLSSSFNLAILFRGEDGRPSSSKLQFMLWIMASIFSYVSLFAAVSWAKGGAPQIVISGELVAALGLSVSALVAAKAITVAQVAHGKTSKPPHRSASLSSLVNDDAGNLDLTKVQMLGWTVIAITTSMIRLAATIRRLPDADLEIPAPDEGLVALCAVGYAAYLGKKLVSTDGPRLTGLSPPSGRAPLQITIMGTALGDSKEGASLTLDGSPVAAFISRWSDERIELTMPSTRPDGTPWPRDRAVPVGVFTGGRVSSNTVPFTFS